MTDDKDNGGGGNSSLSATSAAIVTAFKRMDDLEADRDVINGELNAERKTLYAEHGITPSALARARALYKMDEDKRKVEQLAIAVCETAIGIAQTDLFDHLETPPLPEKKPVGRPKSSDTDQASAS